MTARSRAYDGAPRWPKRLFRNFCTPRTARDRLLDRSPARSRSWENEARQRMKPAIPERRPATEEISGVIERVTLHNDDSDFRVL